MKVNQLRTGAVLSYLALILNIMISLAYTPFMLSSLGQAEYGVFTLVNATIVYFTLLDFGFGNAIVRYTAQYRVIEDKNKERTLHGMFLLLYTLIGLIVILLGTVVIANIETLFSKSLSCSEIELARILMWLAVLNLSIVFPFTVFSSIITAYEKFVFAQTVKIIRIIINPLLFVLVLSLGFKSVGLIVATILLSLVFNLINFYYCIVKLKIRVSLFNFDSTMFKEIISYSFYIFLGSIVDMIYWNTGQFLLGIYSGAVAVAIFSIGLSFNSYYMSLSTSIVSVFLPRVTAISIKESDDKQLSDLFIRVGRIQFIVVALALGGFILLGRQFICLWAGNEYNDSYYVALLLLLPVTVPLIQNLGISILQAKNMHGFRSKIYLVIAIVNILISIPLIKTWGSIGCAIGTAGALCIGQIVVMNIYYNKKAGLNIAKFWLEILKLIPAVIMAGIIAIAFMSIVIIGGKIGLLVNGLVFIAAYCICMSFFGLNQYERKLFFSPIQAVFIQHEKQEVKK